MADNPSAEPDGSVAAGPGSLLALRLAIGLVQGLIAWQLLDMLPRTQFPPAEDMLRSWPYRNPGLFAILTMITSFVPVVALAQAGRIRKRPLVLYLVMLAAVLAGLGAYDIWRDPFDSGWGTQTIRIWPSTTLIFCTATGLFIANQLLEHREGGNSLWSAYADHFEDSWMRGFQFVVALVFTALVWGVLELGRSMFDLIHLDGFGHMLEHNWFRCPALAMAFAGSVHITDVRPTLLHGMRNLGLTLLSWLLPLIVALGWSFLLALPFTGLAPLWGTGFAAAILLWAVAVTLVLVNAAYKDGQGTPPLAIRWAGRGAMPMMLILTLLAAYAIGLRVWQYGWTPMRLRSAMVAVIALVYAAGYSRAAVRKDPWLRGIEPVNITASLGILMVLVLKLTPLADPARVSVNSQVGRLTAGQLAPAKFDYQFLRFGAGRYGMNALTAMTHSANADVASRAHLALTARTRSYSVAGQGPDPTLTEAPLTHAAIHPQGATLPDDFRHTVWGDDDALSADCLRNGTPCDIIVLPQGKTASPLLLVIAGPDQGTKAAARAVMTSSSPIFGRDDHGAWHRLGDIHMTDCPGIREALRLGAATSARPLHDDLMANGLRLTFTPTPSDRCPARAAPAKAPPVPPRDASAPVYMGPAFGKP